MSKKEIRAILVEGCLCSGFCSPYEECKTCEILDGLAEDIQDFIKRNYRRKQLRTPPPHYPPHPENKEEK